MSGLLSLPAWMSSHPRRTSVCMRPAAFVLAMALPLIAVVQTRAQHGAPEEAAVSADSRARLTWQKFPVEFADYYCQQGIPIKPLDHKPDFCKSDNALLLDGRHSPFRTTMIIDSSGGTGGSYDTLYVDYNRNGDYTDDPVYTAQPFKGKRGPDWQPVRAYFSDVAMPRPSIPDAKPHVQVFLCVSNGILIPQNWAVGTLKAGGKTMPAAIVDTNWNDDVADLGGYRAGQNPAVPPKGDYLFLGIDGEKQLRPGVESRDSLFVPGEGGSARGFLTKYLVLDSGTYELKASQAVARGGPGSDTGTSAPWHRPTHARADPVARAHGGAVDVRDAVGPSD